jgi:hypothetical protein
MSAPWIGRQAAAELLGMTRSNLTYLEQSRPHQFVRVETGTSETGFEVAGLVEYAKERAAESRALANRRIASAESALNKCRERENAVRSLEAMIEWVKA